MRRIFKDLLYEEMAANPSIYLLTGDLGYGMFDKIRDNFHDRYFNVGSSEQLLIGTAIGLSLSDKIPVCYSITPFLLYRPFEFIRNYLNHENIPVKLVGGGLYEDYGNLGFTHHCNDYNDVLRLFDNIKKFTPTKEELNMQYLRDFLYNKKPSFLGLRR